MLEVAAVAPGELVDVIDAGLASRVLDRRELDRVLARNRPCRGAARLAAIVGDPDAMALTRSKRERAFLRLVRQAGLRVPETNVKFGRYEADFLWRRERLVVEIDGYNYHTGPAVFSRDREKERLIPVGPQRLVVVAGERDRELLVRVGRRVRPLLPRGRGLHLQRRRVHVGPLCTSERHRRRIVRDDSFEQLGGRGSPARSRGGFRRARR